jgi:flavin reductase (DIM6/NTAB) family NADH-FMN oxidoreductase RutF
MSEHAQSNKVDVRPQWWDSMFAPSSCLVLITTCDDEGRVNAAAFGTCTRVCHDPVHIAFTVGLSKDTANNVLANGQFVVNVVPFEADMLDRTLVCGLPFRPTNDELAAAGLSALPSRVVRPPRILECRSHFECSVAWTHPWLNRLMVCGKVEAVSADADCIDTQGHVVWDRLKPAHYCGARYGNKFVPVYEKPTPAHWRYEGTDDDFIEGQDWQTAFYPDLKK